MAAQVLFRAQAFDRKPPLFFFQGKRDKISHKLPPIAFVTRYQDCEGDNSYPKPIFTWQSVPPAKVRRHDKELAFQ